MYQKGRILTEVLKMKKSKEYKICFGSFCICLILYGISMVTGLMPGLTSSIDKICMYLGHTFLCLGILFSYKIGNSKNTDKQE